MKKFLRFSILFGVVFGSGVTQVHAITTSEYLEKYSETRENSRNGTINHLSESFELVALLAEWTTMQVSGQIFSQIDIDNPESSLAGGLNYAFYEEGGLNAVDLTYQWYFASDYALAQTPDQIFGVRYEVNLVPELNNFSLIAESFNRASDFSVSYLVNGYEPIIRATPLNINGNVLSFIDANVGEIGQGYAMNLQVVPEPASYFLMLTGLFSVFFSRFAVKKRAGLGGSSYDRKS